MTTTVKNNFLPPSLISNLQQVLISPSDGGAGIEPPQASKTCGSAQTSSASSALSSCSINVERNCTKPVVLVTNGEGIESPGLTFLVEALVLDGRFSVHVCAPQSDKSASSHSLTMRETIAVCSAEISGATAYEVSGTPVDCVSLALSGALFTWSKPVLVISGINRGSSCGHNILYSGAVAAAKEALICGVPSLCISLNWKKDVSCEKDLKDAANVCLPIVSAAVRDIQKQNFPEGCSLKVEIPSSPLTNKGIKLTRHSLWRSYLRWKAVSANRHPASGQYLSNQQSLGVKLAQLSRDASAAGAARRLNSHRKNVEIESVGVAGKVNGQQAVKKYFCLELMEKEPENVEDDLDFQALGEGYVAVTPLSLSSTDQSKIQTSVSNWIDAALGREQ